MVSSARGTLHLLTPHPPMHTALRWQARISIDRKLTGLGTYASEREAALRYDREARSMGKDTNFNLDGTKGNAKKPPPPNPKGVSWNSRDQW